MKTASLIALLSALGATALGTFVFAGVHHPAEPVVEVRPRDVEPARRAPLVTAPRTDFATSTAPFAALREAPQDPALRPLAVATALRRRNLTLHGRRTR